MAQGGLTGWLAVCVWNHQTRTKSSQIIAHHRRRPPNELNEILHEQNLVVKFCGRLDSRVVLVAFIDLTGRANVLLTELTLACRPTFNQRENKISFFLLLRLFALIANKQGWWRRRWLGDVASLDSVPVLLPSPSRSQFLLSNQFANWNLRNSPSSLSDRATGRASECQSCYHHYYSVCVCGCGQSAKFRILGSQRPSLHSLVVWSSDLRASVEHYWFEFWTPSYWPTESILSSFPLRSISQLATTGYIQAKAVLNNEISTGKKVMFLIAHYYRLPMNN